MSNELLRTVQSRYAAVAESDLSSEHAGMKAVAETFGYTAEDLTRLLSEYDVNAAAASVKMYAVKPAQKSCCGPTCCG